MNEKWSIPEFQQLVVVVELVKAGGNCLFIVESLVFEFTIRLEWFLLGHWVSDPSSNCIFQLFSGFFNKFFPDFFTKSFWRLPAAFDG
jgi:hypothetical protein